jgi:MFS transporter, DHA3 family, macrolide efflux protein
MLPVLRPLKDRAIATLWLGMAASTIGEDVFRVAIVWLAVEIAGNQAGLVTAAQNATMLVVGLTAGAIAERWRPDRTLVTVSLASAAIVMLPVIVGTFFDVSLALLIATVVGLAVLRTFYAPALQSVIPTMVRDRESLQSVNGLIDTTWRLARLVGPALAALLSAILPVIHFLTVTALGLLWAAASVFAVRDRLQRDPADVPKIDPGWRGLLSSMAIGYRLLLFRDRVMTILMLSNALVNGPWMVTLMLGVALLVKTYDPRFLGIQDLAAYGIVMGAYGVGDLCANLYVGSVRRPLQVMYLGYVAMGGGFVLMALATWAVQPGWLLPAMMLAAVIAGVGGPFFFIPMITRLQTVFRGADIARVFRIRMAVMAGMQLIASLGGTVLFERLGATTTVLGSGLFILGIGIAGSIYFGRMFVPPAEPPAASS